MDNDDLGVDIELETGDRDALRVIFAELGLNAKVRDRAGVGIDPDSGQQ